MHRFSPIGGPNRVERMSTTTPNESHPLDDPHPEPFELAALAAAKTASATGVDHPAIALTLGSGWARAADLIAETTATIPPTDIAGFSKPALEGHVGSIRSIL